MRIMAKQKKLKVDIGAMVRVLRSGIDLKANPMCLEGLKLAHTSCKSRFEAYYPREFTI